MRAAHDLNLRCTSPGGRRWALCARREPPGFCCADPSGDDLEESRGRSDSCLRRRAARKCAVIRALHFKLCAPKSVEALIVSGTSAQHILSFGISFRIGEPAKPGCQCALELRGDGGKLLQVQRGRAAVPERGRRPSFHCTSSDRRG
ncbi:hypothetical protein OJAV_G00120210 [Oryzias javanicus]|uniref:Uncharacterized protein n=1 Tax=Oryzias javanicus TaxID=123683 RepID=A0A3S2MSD4_ORYJA|nr:hypothetical protein OJAV_G00120210 [Oryzias javanicus]